CGVDEVVHISSGGIVFPVRILEEVGVSTMLTGKVVARAESVVGDHVFSPPLQQGRSPACWSNSGGEDFFPGEGEGESMDKGSPFQKVMGGKRQVRGSVQS
ncbi:hypothetical protein A2U01_0071600, partial [Trifolium medium]|nr:hypothetical protein [Trifolium medium]